MRHSNAVVLPHEKGHTLRTAALYKTDLTQAGTVQVEWVVARHEVFVYGVPRDLMRDFNGLVEALVLSGRLSAVAGVLHTVYALFPQAGTGLAGN